MGSIKSLKYASESSDEALEKRPQESVIIESFEEEYEEYLQLKVRRKTYILFDRFSYSAMLGLL